MTTTPDQCIRDALGTDPVLRSLGFDHHTVGSEPPPAGPGIVLGWSGEWAASGTAALGTVVVEVTGVDGRTRAAVLDRVEVVLSGLRDGPVRRVGAGSPAEGVTVLAGTGEPAGRTAPSATVG
ncbi:hypothetical protein [Pseudonocardia sp. ICBG1293]|uniref:hypothetical protein n=1 Tax=Pseudonocardia sp. ICBG1293 TaxID=2844382 RepID=UPI001CC9998C|nr:hypothetical protein [Pseudonocardia sp. ICBG1293]